jgi:hypothetical protein
MRLAISSWDELRLDRAFGHSIHCEICPRSVSKNCSAAVKP